MEQPLTVDIMKSRVPFIHIISKSIIMFNHYAYNLSFYAYGLQNK